MNVDQGRIERSRALRWPLAVAIACLSAAAGAQVAGPSDQELLRQQERERVLREQQETTPDVRLQAAPEKVVGRLPVDESPCFTIDHIVLDGDLAECFGWAQNCLFKVPQLIANPLIRDLLKPRETPDAQAPPVIDWSKFGSRLW